MHKTQVLEAAHKRLVDGESAKAALVARLALLKADLIERQAAVDTANEEVAALEARVAARDGVSIPYWDTETQPPLVPAATRARLLLLDLASLDPDMRELLIAYKQTGQPPPPSELALTATMPDERCDIADMEESECLGSPCSAGGKGGNGQTARAMPYGKA